MSFPENRSRITLFISGLKGGGAEGVCVTLANSLADAGYSVELVVLNMDGSVRHCDISDKVKFVNIGKKHARAAVFSLYKYLKESGTPLVLSFNAHLSVLLVLIRKITGLKFKLVSRVISVTSSAAENRKGIWQKYFVNSLVKKLYSESDLFITQSDAMARDLREYTGTNKKVYVINNPVNKEIEKYREYNPVKKERQNYILCAGRLEAVKGFSYAIEAISKLHSEFPSLRLKIVGSGTQEKDLRNKAESLGAGSLVDFEGFRKDIITYFVNAELTLLTSLYEGYPNVLIESISLGTPVVAFNCPGGTSEIVQEGVNGFLAEHSNIDDLVQKLRKALLNDWNYENIVKTSFKYSSESIIKKYSSALFDDNTVN